LKENCIITIITAMKEEAESVEKKLFRQGYTKKDGFYIITPGTKLYILRCGVLFSKRKQFEKKIDILRDSFIVILAGICGAINERFSRFDITIPDNTLHLNNLHRESVINHPYLAKAKSFLEQSFSCYKPSSVIATSDHFVDTAEKRKLRSQQTADIVDMEFYNVHNWLINNGIESICIKCVSDVSTEILPSQEELIEYMREPRDYIVKNILFHPLRCFYLIRLAKNSLSASRRLADCITGLIEYIAQNNTGIGNNTN